MPPDMTVECTTLYGYTIQLPKNRLVVRPSAYAIIRHEDKIVLVTNLRSGKYYFPGGGIEQGERVIEGLKREVTEETGLEIEDEQLIHFAEDFFYHDLLDEAYHALLFYYACEPTTRELSAPIRLDDGEGNPQWVAVDGLKAHDFHNHGNLLLRVLQSVTNLQ